MMEMKWLMSLTLYFISTLGFRSITLVLHHTHTHTHTIKTSNCIMTSPSSVCSTPLPHGQARREEEVDGYTHHWETLLKCRVNLVNMGQRSSFCSLAQYNISLTCTCACVCLQEIKMCVSNMFIFLFSLHLHLASGRSHCPGWSSAGLDSLGESQILHSSSYNTQPNTVPHTSADHTYICTIT